MSVAWLCFLIFLIVALGVEMVFGTPSIAQLVERRTVECVILRSLSSNPRRIFLIIWI